MSPNIVHKHEYNIYNYNIQRVNINKTFLYSNMTQVNQIIYTLNNIQIYSIGRVSVHN